MNVIPLITESSRLEGCTLLGALSITTSFRDAVTIIHGPSGCTQHNFSLLHATYIADGIPALPHLLSTHLSEDEIIFGGEEALETALRDVAGRDPRCIFVLSTCIVDTIGDDTSAVCRKSWGVPVIYLPTSGFLGGGFNQGLITTLLTLARIVEPVETHPRTVALIGEKNLEYEVEENYAEITRLLNSLGVRVELRFVRNLCFADIDRLGRAALNILRDPFLEPVGQLLERKFHTPFIDRMPEGFSGTLRFLTDVAQHLTLDARPALQKEKAFQNTVRAKFADLRGVAVNFGPDHHLSSGIPAIDETVTALGLYPATEGVMLPIPVPVPIGTAGMERLLHRWRRVIHASL